MPALQAFAERVECVLVVTQPDRPAGRGQRLQPTPVKAAALELAIPTYEPHSLRDALGTLRGADAGLFAVASYGKILPQPVLEIPPCGALNVHPSVLPLYRGATPLQAQLRDGVTTGGVTIILMDAGMDTGGSQHSAPNCWRVPAIWLPPGRSSGGPRPGSRVRTRSPGR